MGILWRYLRTGRWADLVVGCLCLGIVILMVVPAPIALLDVLICANLSLGALTLLHALMGKPSQWSAIPTLLLLTTLYRLALNVSSTRQILTQAHAGQVISAFGAYVVGNNIAVGAILFGMLTLIQLAVIAKGAERIAEVSARFALDALPGRQLAIESAERRGALGRVQAKRLHEALGRESQFFGAMDGAMKFVKGDAVVSLLITAINFAAGTALGVFQLNLELATSLHTFGTLTIGDGLAAQLPALLLSTAAGVIVTRSNGSSNVPLTAELSAPFRDEPRLLVVAAIFLGLLACLSSLPAFPLSLCAAGLLALACNAQRQKELRDIAQGVPQESPLTLRLQARLYRQLAPLLQEDYAALRQRFLNERGQPLPPIRLQPAPLPTGGYEVHIHQVPVRHGVLDNGLPLKTAATQITAATEEALREQGHQLLDLQLLQEMLDAIETEQPARVRAFIPHALPLIELLGLLQKLLRDGLPITGLGQLVEQAGQLRTHAPRLQGEPLYAALRERLGPAISYAYARQHALLALQLDPLWLALLEDAQSLDAPHELHLDASHARDLSSALMRHMGQPHRPAAVLLVPAGLRAAVSAWLRPHLPTLPVLSPTEVAAGLRVSRPAPIVCNGSAVAVDEGHRWTTETGAG